MPYADKDSIRFSKRNAKRTKRHGNWRQIVVDCGCMCCYIDEDGLPCGGTVGLEFHAPQTEEGGNNRMLYCRLHHTEEHPEYQLTLMTHTWQPNPSVLAEDIEFEITKAGSYSNWIKKFGLVDTFGIRLIYGT